MKRVLLATTAVAAFVAFSGTAQAQDPGRADYGATEGGGGAGSAFTVTTSGAVKAYLKYASGKDSGASVPAVRNAEAALAALATDADRTAANDAVGAARDTEASSGFFTLLNADLEINGAATTDGGTDIGVHIDFNFSGNESDSTDKLGGTDQELNIGRFVRVDELSLKIGGNWGSIQMGRDDGAEDTFKIYGASVSAGTGGIDGDQHTVNGGVDYAGTGGQAGVGDSGDALKVTYLSPKVVGFQAGVSLAYQTSGPGDSNGGTLGVGLGAKYGGSAGGVDYAASLVWGDKNIAADVSDDGDGNGHKEDGYGGLGIGLKVGGAGASFATGVTLNNLGIDDTYKVTDVDGEKKKGLGIQWSGGVAYAIPGGKANASVTAALDIPHGLSSEGKYGLNIDGWLLMASADYAILPGVVIALDLGYGDSNLTGHTLINTTSEVVDGETVVTSRTADNVKTDSAGFTGLIRVKASF